MSRDISARSVPVDPLVVHLEAARAEVVKLRARVVDLEAEMQRARRALASSRASLSWEREARREEVEGLKFKLRFAAGCIKRLKGGRVS
jgi:hypothetical protein